MRNRFKIFHPLLALLLIVIYSLITSFASLRLYNNPENDTPRPRVAFYMTTHGSELHFDFVQKCWPSATNHFQFLQEADLIVHVPKRIAINETWINALLKLKFRRCIIHAEEDDAKIIGQYQQGAIWSLVSGFEQHYFDGYDWVFRLNPDVLIVDDSFLRHVVQRKDAQVVGGYCARLLQSDFVGFRPDIFDNYHTPLNLLRNKTSISAETFNTQLFWKGGNNFTVYEVPGSRHDTFSCRIRGDKSPVQHVHRLLSTCPNYLRRFKKAFLPPFQKDTPLIPFGAQQIK